MERDVPALATKSEIAFLHSEIEQLRARAFEQELALHRRDWELSDLKFKWANAVMTVQFGAITVGLDLLFFQGCEADRWRSLNHRYRGPEIRHLGRKYPIAWRASGG